MSSSPAPAVSARPTALAVPVTASGERVVVLGLAALALAASVIHAAVIPAHLDAWRPEGAFFAAVATAQLAWAAVVSSRPTRAVLLLGAAGHVALIALWVASRTVGLPVGPDAGAPETAGVLDVLATLTALLTIGGVALLVSRRTRVWRPVIAVSVVVVAAGLVLPFTGVAQHTHGGAHQDGARHAHP